MSNALFCLASNATIANSIVAKLKSATFEDKDISVLFPDKSSTKRFADKMQTKSPDGAAVGAGTGGVAGGALGLLAGIGLLAIPGAGPFLAAGPIVAALSGIAVGATVGGIAGALVGMGISELDANRYEKKIKEGNILICVHADDADERSEAKKIFKNERATDIAEANAPEGTVAQAKPNVVLRNTSLRAAATKDKGKAAVGTEAQRLKQ